MAEDDGEGDPLLSPDEAFAILGDETRVAIMRALADAGEPVGFTDLRTAVGLQQGENFNYHLTKLLGHFVEKTDDGYALRQPGYRVIRAVLAGTFTEDISLDPAVIDERCVYCGAEVEMAYDAGILTVRCLGCGGVAGEDLPEGITMYYDFPPAGIHDRTREDALDASHIHYDSRITPMIEGVCPECAHGVTVSHDVCLDHDRGSDGLCPACDTRYEVWSICECGHCKYRRRFPTWFAAVNHPAVVSFFHEHGLQERIPFRKLTSDNAPFVRDIEQTAVDTDPYRFRITIPIEDERLVVEMDETLAVVDVSEP